MNGARKMSFDLHIVIHAALSLIYLEAAVRSALQRKRYSALHEGVVACLYALLAFFIFLPGL
jgi:hypothetical protein